jgi:DNA-binding transcriptional MerR regulator
LYTSVEIEEKNGIKPYVREFWESTFRVLQGEEDSEGGKHYTEAQSNLFGLMRQWQNEDGMTVEQLRQRLAKASSEVEKQSPTAAKSDLNRQSLGRELEEIITLFRQV